MFHFASLIKFASDSAQMHRACNTQTWVSTQPSDEMSSLQLRCNNTKPTSKPPFISLTCGDTLYPINQLTHTYPRRQTFIQNCNLFWVWPMFTYRLSLCFPDIACHKLSWIRATTTYKYTTNIHIYAEINFWSHFNPTDGVRVSWLISDAELGHIFISMLYLK